MTGAAAIAKTDALRPNAIGFDQKLSWLADLDELIYREIVMTHEHEEGTTFKRYETGEEELIAPSPYDEVYHHFLAMQISLAGREIAMYNNDKTLYNNAYLTFQDYYNREHMPIARVMRWNI